MIIICEICEKYICPPACPNYAGRVVGLGATVGYCYECGGRIHEEEEHFRFYDRFLCDQCADELIPSELLSFLACSDIKDFFELL